MAAAVAMETVAAMTTMAAMTAVAVTEATAVTAATTPAALHLPPLRDGNEATPAPGNGPEEGDGGSPVWL